MSEKKFLDGPGLQYVFAKILGLANTKANKDLSNVDASVLDNLAGAKNYTALADLGLSGAKTMAEVCAAMEIPSRLTLNNSTSAANHISDVPGTYGTIEIVRAAANYCFAVWAKSSGTDPDFHHGTYHGENGWSGWKLVYDENNKPNVDDIGALDYADYYGASSATIPEGSDLDTYTTPGTYRCANGTISKTLVNTPHTTSGFKMTVKNLADNNQLMQEIDAVNGSYNYVRTASRVSGVWTFKEWAGSSSNIKSYTMFDQIDLDDADFAGKDLLTIMRTINTAVGTDAVEFFVHTTPTINPNFRQAILDKLAADVSPFESTWTANITAYMRRSKSLYQSFLIDVVYQHEEYENSVLSAVYNADSDGTDSMSTFVYSKLQDGFLPLAGGTLTGKNLYLAGGIARVLGESNRLQLETFNEAGNTNNRRVLHLRNSTHGNPDIEDAMVLFDTVDGESTTYRIFGEHNQEKMTKILDAEPTVSTVGKTGQHAIFGTSLYVCMGSMTNEEETKYIWVKTTTKKVTKDVKVITTSQTLDLTTLGLSVGDEIIVACVSGGNGGSGGGSTSGTSGMYTGGAAGKGGSKGLKAGGGGAGGGYGAGGGGGGSHDNAYSGTAKGGTGGTGGNCKVETVTIAETSIPITIGAAGSGGNSGASGGTGGTTSFGTLVSVTGGGGAAGGTGGTRYSDSDTNNYRGGGGGGGGGGWYYVSGVSLTQCSKGSNGTSASASAYGKGGNGGGPGNGAGGSGGTSPTNGGDTVDGAGHGAVFIFY